MQHCYLLNLESSRQLPFRKLHTVLGFEARDIDEVHFVPQEPRHVLFDSRSEQKDPESGCEKMLLHLSGPQLPP
jgi:hypothetical protein